MKPVQKKTSAIRVLLIEDQTKVAQLIRLHLQNRGFNVEIAGDGDTGLKMFDKGNYDILLVDHVMPGRSGLEVIREIKSRGPLPPILMISGMGMDDVAVEALKLGAMDYIVKDPDTNFLKNLPVIMQDAIEKHRKAEEAHKASEERDRWMNELQQRLRELGCLYGIEKLVASEGESIDVVLQSVIQVVPGACPNPGLCAARLRLGDRTYRSEGYKETEWQQSFELRDRGKEIGRLDVGYREPPPEMRDPIFSEEEHDLLRSVADRLGQFIEKWRTEHELGERNEELRKLYRAVEQSASAVMITDAEGTIEYVNSKFLEMSGYSKEEVLGENPRILKSGEVDPDEYAQLWRVLLSGKVWRGEFHNKKKDGTFYWDYSTVSPITGPDGKVTHFVAVKEDITATKEAEQHREAMLQLSARIAGCETEDDICRVVVEGVRELMNVDRCGLFLGDQNDVTFHGTYGTDLAGKTTDEHDHDWNISKERDVLDLFTSKAYQTGFPLGAPDARPGEEDQSSTLIALRRSGSVFGIISIDNRLSRRPVTESLMVHIALLAEVLGNALRVARAREELRQSVEQTRHANDELEAFNRAMIGRENRIIELKTEVNKLLAEQGEDPRYPPVWDGSGKLTDEKGAPGAES